MLKKLQKKNQSWSSRCVTANTWKEIANGILWYDDIQLISCCLTI